MLLLQVTSRLREPGLTSREAKGLHWIAEGKTNTELALILETAKRTVDKHTERIFRKLGAETRTAALLGAIELRKTGLVRADEPGP